MEKSFAAKLTSDEASQIAATIAKYDEALVEMFKEMKRDQAEIKKLKAETRAILAKLKAA